jgi:hypothetical protein
VPVDRDQHSGMEMDDTVRPAQPAELLLTSPTEGGVLPTSPIAGTPSNRISEPSVSFWESAHSD